MALLKPEVNPTSPAIFGDTWFFIYFSYKYNLIGKQAEVKLFDMNNNQIKPVNSEWLHFLQFDNVGDKDNLYSALFDWDGNNLLTEGQFYKASIRIVDKSSGELSPWSNFTIFKQTSAPEVTRSIWGKEKDFFLNDCVIYSLANASDKTETLEKIEYSYIVLRDDGENTQMETLPVEECFYSDFYNENYEYKINLKSLLDYNFIRSKNDVIIQVGLQITFFTRSGSLSKYWAPDDGPSFTIDPSYLHIQCNTQDQYGNILVNITSETNNHFHYRVYNQDLLILDSINFEGSFLDHSANYINDYFCFSLQQEFVKGEIDEEDKYIALQDKNGNYVVDTAFINFQICDFDSIFLVDAKEDVQLNITLNNSINSLKYNILETKTDTIGSQYPIFFRKPNTRYREFPLSGTISYHSLISFGEEYKIDFTLPEFPHTNLTTDNLYAERIFREKVIEFLTKDRPLLYKSQTEGNIVVKLMNIQLTPNKTLGRMIYDFSCTCYEVQDLQSYVKECQE